MKTLKFRNLTKDEIEVRVGGGNSLLLYKTARVDANILDETVGAFNWQKRFYQVKNTMICEIGINLYYDDPNKEPLWVFKADGGDDDYTMERVKAECSDSMKRAAFQWGIGRSLYSAPRITIPEQFKSAKYFEVDTIEYDSKGNISKLVITTNFGKDIVFTYPKTRNYSQNGEKAPKEESPTTKVDTEDENAPIREEEKQILVEYVGKLSREQYNAFFAWLKSDYGCETINGLTASQGIIVVGRLKRSNKL